MPHQPPVLLWQSFVARRGSVADTFLIGLGASLILTVCLLVAAVLIAVRYRSIPPEEEISQQIDALLQAAVEGRFGETYRTHTTLALRESSSPQQYAQLGEAIQEKFGRLISKEQTEFQMETVAGVLGAVVVYQGTFEKGPATISAELRKVERKWILRAFDVSPPRAAAPEPAK